MLSLLKRLLFSTAICSPFIINLFVYTILTTGLSIRRYGLVKVNFLLLYSQMLLQLTTLSN